MDSLQMKSNVSASYTKKLKKIPTKTTDTETNNKTVNEYLA